jgi:hypothetical protein
MKNFDYKNDYFLRANFLTSKNIEFVFTSAFFASHDAMKRNEAAIYFITLNSKCEVIEENIDNLTSDDLAEIRERFPHEDLLLEMQNDTYEYTLSVENEIDVLHKHTTHGTCVFYEDAIEL